MKKMYANNRQNYDQNDGKEEVVYIITNSTFKDNIIKIGCSRYSGFRRAEQMNMAASKANYPGTYFFRFEKKTMDCGVVEKAVHEYLRKYRKGKWGARHDGSAWGQEFFAVDVALKTIEDVISIACSKADVLHADGGKVDVETVVKELKKNSILENAEKRFPRSNIKSSPKMLKV